ncbi:hypothetical protein [Fusibacter ferrireducens]|uniref:Uncharacterized protein n=1 Tax=Fusibacter ferrireducens TaxID=2785058 RepID=A0ABR9ZTI0_9FIRM|nr:hypothetical protein [Fusibacter ferrireducens]MBF4693453.1 hypothetical protein [Fusibacter ferrireducens]
MSFLIHNLAEFLITFIDIYITVLGNIFSIYFFLMTVLALCLWYIKKKEIWEDTYSFEHGLAILNGTGFVVFCISIYDAIVEAGPMGVAYSFFLPVSLVFAGISIVMLLELITFKSKYRKAHQKVFVRTLVSTTIILIICVVLFQFLKSMYR